MPNVHKKYEDWINSGSSSQKSPASTFAFLTLDMRNAVLQALAEVFQANLNQINAFLANAPIRNAHSKVSQSNQQTPRQQAGQGRGTPTNPMLQGDGAPATRLAEWAVQNLSQNLNNEQQKELKEGLTYLYGLALKKAPTLKNLPKPTFGGGRRPEDKPNYVPTLKPSPFK
jgi:hypothetical protein